MRKNFSHLDVIYWYTYVLGKTCSVVTEKKCSMQFTEHCMCKIIIIPTNYGGMMMMKKMKEAGNVIFTTGKPAT